MAERIESFNKAILSIDRVTLFVQFKVNLFSLVLFESMQFTEQEKKNNSKTYRLPSKVRRTVAASCWSVGDAMLFMCRVLFFRDWRNHSLWCARIRMQLVRIRLSLPTFAHKWLAQSVCATSIAKSRAQQVLSLALRVCLFECNIRVVYWALIGDKGHTITNTNKPRATRFYALIAEDTWKKRIVLLGELECAVRSSDSPQTRGWISNELSHSLFYVYFQSQINVFQ